MPSKSEHPRNLLQYERTPGTGCGKLLLILSPTNSAYIFWLLYLLKHCRVVSGIQGRVTLTLALSSVRSVNCYALVGLQMFVDVGRV